MRRASVNALYMRGAAPNGDRSRRLVLKRFALALPVLSAISGCGGGDSPSAPPSEPSRVTDTQAKPLLTLYTYPQGADKTPAKVVLQVQRDGTYRATDRFSAQDVYCDGFSGAASSALAASIPPLGSAGFSLGCWFSPDVSSGSMALLSLQFGDAPSAWKLELDAQGLPQLSGAGIQLSLADCPDLRDGGWHHVILQVVSNRVSVVIDAIHSSSATISIAPARSPSQIVFGLNSWQGAIDDVRLYDRLFDADRIPALVYEWRKVSASNRADSIAGYYPFNGNAKNATGHGVDGKETNIATTADRHGNASAARLFNGADSSFTLNDSFDVFNEDYAIAFWLKTSSTRSMVAFHATGPGTALSISVNDSSGICVDLIGTRQERIQTGLPGLLSDGRWHFVVFQSAEGKSELYVDGEFRGTTAFAPPLMGPGSVVELGGKPGAAAAIRWLGALDDLQLYVRSFTLQQVRDLESLQFLPMDGAGLLSFSGRLWLLGGWNSERNPSTHNEVWNSQDGVAWEFVGNAPWAGRHMAGWTVHDGLMWVVGGDKNSGSYQNDVWCSADGVTWQQKTDSPPWAGRASHAVATFNDRIWLMGGQELLNSDHPQDSIVYQDIYSTADGAQWRQESSHAAWSARGLIIGQAIHAGKMWLLGGGQYDIRSYKNDIWSSEDGIEWHQVRPDAPWSPRQFHNIAAFDNKLWILGGGTATAPGGTNDVWFSYDGAKWCQLPDTPWEARHAASVTAHAGKLWLIAGSSSRLYSDIWHLSYTS